MEQIVFGETTVKDLLVYAGLIVGALIVLGLLARLLRRSKPPAQVQTVRCRCGWQGQVSRLAGRCPKCNAPLGDRRVGGGEG